MTQPLTEQETIVTLRALSSRAVEISTELASLENNTSAPETARAYLEWEARHVESAIRKLETPAT